MVYLDNSMKELDKLNRLLAEFSDVTNNMTVDKTKHIVGRPKYNQTAIETLIGNKIVKNPKARVYFKMLQMNEIMKDKVYYLFFSAFVLPNKKSWAEYNGYIVNEPKE